jgi:phage-related tail protein
MKRPLLLALMFCAVSLLLTGCAALLVGAAAGAGGVAYVQGELKVTESVSLAVAQRAAEKALTDLKLGIQKRQADGLSGVLEARTAGDQKITVKTKRIADKSTEIGIRVGVLGDEAKSRQILNRIQASY